MLALQIMASHLLGDYILQNDYMALGKKRSSWICLIHVSLYMTGFLTMVLIGNLSTLAFILIAIQHFIQDRTNIVMWWMGFYGQDNFSKPPCGPWSIFVVDNSLHIIFITIVLSLGI